MKNGKGIAVLILIAFGIPLLMDFLMSYFIDNLGEKQLTISSILFSGYILLLPKFIYHIVVASALVYLIKPAGKSKTERTDE